MPNPYFKFKQFTVYHDKCAMKVGTDGVLLGAWCKPENASEILDIGTGTGLIALMLAQKTSASIVAIDIDEKAVLQARENVKRSDWKTRIEIYHARFQDFTKDSTMKYDLIVSNPPYFVDSLKARTENRSLARHTAELSHSDLLKNSLYLLSENGRLCLILPLVEGEKFIEMAAELNLFCHKKTYVYPRTGLDVKRLLLEFGFQKQECIELSLTIETNERHTYTAEFINLAKDYYLKF